MKYARVLLEHCPQDTTQLFVDGHYEPKQRLIVVEAAPHQQGLGAGALNAVQYVSLLHRC
jgi:hypothetical protein